MRQTGQGQQRQRARPAKGWMRCWLVLLLMAAFAVSTPGLSSGSGGGHEVQAALHPHMTVTASASADEACCADHHARHHGAECGMVGGCAFCAPAATAAAWANPDPNNAGIPPDATRAGLTLPPSLRPPKFLAIA